METVNMIDLISLLDDRSQDMFYRSISSIHTRALETLNNLSIPERLAITQRVTDNPVKVASDMPSELPKKIGDKIVSRREFMYMEGSVLSLIKRTRQDLLDAGKDFTAEDIADIESEVTQLLYVYEDFIPLELSITSYIQMVLNREKISLMLHGLPIDSDDVQMVFPNEEDKVATLVEHLARATHWPLVAKYIKDGTAKYEKRKRKVIHELCNHITLIRLSMLEKGEISSILDQTAYDLVEEDFKFSENKDSRDNLIKAIITDINDDLGEYFQGKVCMIDLILALVEFTRLAGVEDVCVVHHYSE